MSVEWFERMLGRLLGTKRCIRRVHNTMDRQTRGNSMAGSLIGTSPHVREGTLYMGSSPSKSLRQALIPKLEAAPFDEWQFW